MGLFSNFGKSNQEIATLDLRTQQEPMPALALSPQRVAEKRPSIKPAIDTDVLDEASIAEYRQVAGSIGLAAADLMVEEFRIFLKNRDMPVFNLAEVCRYMDEVAARDNPTGFGWHWCPVRPKDGGPPMTWGRPSRWHGGVSREPASDFYESHQFQTWMRGSGGFVAVTTVTMGHSGSLAVPFPPRPVLPDWRDMPSPAYTHTIPLHALKKIQLIEKQFGKGVVFLVSDYTVTADVVVNPDPFLMAVIPNAAVAHGKGRFVIDIWDEPDFGLRMFK